MKRRDRDKLRALVERVLNQWHEQRPVFDETVDALTDLLVFVMEYITSRCAR